MKRKIKIIIAVLVGIIGIGLFFVFFYPDEKLEDFSDLTPVIQNVSVENNAFKFVEDAASNYKKSQDDPADIISFLTGGAATPANLKSKKFKDFSNEDIEKFLNLEDASIKLLEQAEQFSSYKNPKEEKYQTLVFSDTLPAAIPGTATLFKSLFVKGLYEFKQGQAEEGVQTILKSMELAAKMRRSSLSLIEYLVNTDILVQGKDILNYFAKNGVAISTDVAAKIAGLKDDGGKDFINTLKFEFQT